MRNLSTSVSVKRQVSWLVYISSYADVGEAIIIKQEFEGERRAGRRPNWG